MPDLAIVIPAYKSTYLSQTLDSIANQTDKRFHLYIGDDCSPYDLESIVRQYEEKISITYKRFDTNIGGKDLVSQWERCIALIQNESYIWLFSDDDTMDTNCVESFYRYVSVYPEEQLFHFNVNMIDSMVGGKINSLPEFPEKMSAGEYLESKLKGRVVSFVVEFIFSRNLYITVNRFQNFDLAWGSDFITWLKMAANTKNGIITIRGNNCTVNWRKSDENISPNKTKQMLMRKIPALIENAKFIKKELKQYPSKYLPLKASFRWWRFALGEIWRNKDILSIKDKIQLCYKYTMSIYCHSK